MMKQKLFLIGAALLMFLGAKAATFNVAVGNNINPDSLYIQLGDSVKWSNNSGIRGLDGTTTTYPGNPTSFSHQMGFGWVYHFEFNIPGTYLYKETNGGKVAKIVVAGASGPGLAAGDIAFTGVQSDAPDGFAFVTLVDIPANTNITFTDRSVNSSSFWFGSGEADTVVWTSPSSVVLAGTMVRYENGAVSNPIVGPGTMVGDLPNISSSGDQVFAYDGNYASPNFIAGVSTNSFITSGIANSNDSYLPSSLVRGFSALQLSTTSTDIDNGYFDCNPNSGPKSFLNNSINNPNFWVKDNDTAVAGRQYWFSCPSVNVGGPIPNLYPQYTIGSVTTSDAAGISDSLNVKCELNGTVHSIDFDGNAGYSLFIYDNTGGINVFSSTDKGGYTAPAIGDSITVKGSIAQFNGLTQIVVDSIFLRSAGNTLKTPTVVSTLTENSESEYIQMKSMALVNPSQWPTAGNSADVDISDGTNTFKMHIDSDTDIDGSPAPTSRFDVRGAGTQVDNSFPYNTGYKIMPSSLAYISVILPSDVDFQTSTMTVQEDTGSVDVNVIISPAVVAADTVVLTFALGTGVVLPNDGSINPAPNLTTGILSYPVSAGDDTLQFTISVLDDAVVESNETLFVDITYVSKGLAIGTSSSFTFIVEDNDIPIPTYQIADIEGTDSQGVADSLGVLMRLRGIVTSPGLQSSNLDFFYTDSSNNAGIKVFSFGANAYTPTMGDELKVVGTLAQFRGQIQINPDSIVVLSTGNVVAPDVETDLDESTEGRVVRLNGVKLVDTTGWGSGNFEIILASGDTTILRLDSDIMTNWGPAPVKRFDVIGVAGQFASSSAPPFDDGYQIQPRAGDEIIRRVVSMAITEVLPSSTHLVPIDGDWFEVTNYGDTAIDMNGYSWDNDGATPGTHEVTSSLVVQPGRSVIFLQATPPDDAAWMTSWGLTGSGLEIITEDEFGAIGFTGLSASADEVNLYDESDILVSKVAWVSGDVSAGFSLEFDTTGALIGSSVDGTNGAYTSSNGDVGSPGNVISIEEFEQVKVELYPNPASDWLFVETSEPTEKRIVISNLLGKTMDEIFTNESFTEIPLVHLNKGVYLVSIEIDGQTATRKIVVQ